MKENEEIKKAKEEYEYLTGDEAERRIAFLRDKAIRDEKSMLEGAREEAIQQGLEEGRERGREEGRKEGRKEGKKEGRKEEKMKIAKQLLKIGMSIKQIVEITELSEEEIKKLK